MFEAFSRVLARETLEDEWRPDIYLYRDGDAYVCARCRAKYIIVYDGNEKLEGTNDIS